MWCCLPRISPNGNQSDAIATATELPYGDIECIYEEDGAKSEIESIRQKELSSLGGSPKMQIHAIDTLKGQFSTESQSVSTTRVTDDKSSVNEEHGDGDFEVKRANSWLIGGDNNVQPSQQQREFIKSCHSEPAENLIQEYELDDHVDQEYKAADNAGVAAGLAGAGVGGVKRANSWLIDAIGTGAGTPDSATSSSGAKRLLNDGDDDRSSVEGHCSGGEDEGGDGGELALEELAEDAWDEDNNYDNQQTYQTYHDNAGIAEGSYGDYVYAGNEEQAEVRLNVVDVVVVDIFVLCAYCS
jgi:hypothetical protein